MERYFEPMIPISNRELYEMVGNISINELKKEYFKFEGPEPCADSLRLALVRHNGEFTISHPNEDEIPIIIHVRDEVPRQNISHHYDYLRERLESLLKFGVREVKRGVFTDSDKFAFRPAMEGRY